jgi:hypothetical protein
MTLLAAAVTRCSVLTYHSCLQLSLSEFCAPRFQVNTSSLSTNWLSRIRAWLGLLLLFGTARRSQPVPLSVALRAIAHFSLHWINIYRFSVTLQGLLRGTTWTSSPRRSLHLCRPVVRRTTTSVGSKDDFCPGSHCVAHIGARSLVRCCDVSVANNCNC